MIIQHPGTLSTLVDRIRFSALLVGVGFLFLSSFMALALQRELATLTDLLLLVAPFTVGIIGLLLLEGFPRGLLVTIAATLFILGVLILGSAATVLWPPIASLSFALGVIAVSSLPLPWAIGGIAAATIFTRAGVVLDPPRTWLISTNLMDGWVTPLSVLTLSLAFLLVLRAWQIAARKADDAATEVRIQLENALLAGTVDEARRAVDRRLHETLLNTLAALSAPTFDSKALREQCTRDLSSVSREETLSDLSLRNALGEAVRRVPSVTTHIECTSALQLPDSRAAHVVTDALVELLRNVERHSQTHEAWISCNASNQILDICVQDRGIGITASPERFGLRSTVADSMRSIGGSAYLESNEPSGTQAHLCLPRDRQVAALEPPTSLTVLLGSPTARISLAPTLVLGIVALPFAVAGFDFAAWILLGFLITLLAAGALAVGWDRLPRKRLAGVVLASGLVTMAVAALGQQGCMTSTGLHWIIYAEAGAITLSVLAFKAWQARTALVAGVILASVLASLLTPVSCIIDPLDAAFENAIWIIAFIGVVGGLSSIMDKNRTREYALWMDLQQTNAALAARESAESRWRSVNEETWNLVMGVAGGNLEPGSEYVRSRARVQESRLRVLLDVSHMSSPALRQQLESLAEHAASADVPLSVQVLDDDSAAPLQDGELESIRSLITGAHGEPVHMVVLHDSVLCQVPTPPATSVSWETSTIDDETRVVVAIPRVAATGH